MPMTNFGWTLIIGIVVVILAVGSIWYYMDTSGTAPIDTPTTTPSTTTPATTTPEQPSPSATTTTVSIALLDTAGTSSGKSRACDKVVLMPRTIPATTSPLTAAMRELFSLSTTSVGGWFNYIDRTNETLAFSRATIVNGTANIYLTGSLSGMAGVCDDPRAAVQIEETALQFATVDRVVLFLNNATTTLMPSQQ